MSKLKQRLADKRGEPYPRLTRFGDKALEGEADSEAWATTGPRNISLPENRPPMEYWTPERIKALRELAGLSREAFGSMCGKAERTIGGWETGSSRPTSRANEIFCRLALKNNPDWWWC